MELDPRLERLAELLEEREARRRVPRASHHIEAAVALMLRQREAVEMLLVRRADREEDPWSGHVGLPGGQREEGDEDLVETARRETEEETGVDLGEVGRTLGFLDEVTPGGPCLPPIVVSPLVTAVPAELRTEIDPRELRDAAWVPLTALADPAARDEHVERIGGSDVSFPAIRYGEFEVWGLTYRIVTGFLEVAERAWSEF
ncbi:MAG: NUDIX domain-containing protein [Gemmatimonadota bacterium]|nr:NUDIX domain-containing protein [Gemmatimonadota bacterium]